MGWFKDKLLGSRPDKPTIRSPTGTNQAGRCDFCRYYELDSAAGWYYVGNRDVVLSELYWVKVFSALKDLLDSSSTTESQPPQVFQDWVARLVGQRSVWSICENCSELFVFDRDMTRSNASERVDPAGCDLFAAQAWERVFGHWPAGVEQPAVGDTCDLCRKQIYGGEFAGFVPRARMERLRAEGFVDNDPVRPPRPRGDDTGWIVCQPCMARQLARFHRAGRRPDVSG